MPRRLLPPFGLLLLGLLAAPASAQAPVSIQDSIPVFMGRVADALNRRDIARVLATYADTGLVVSSSFGHVVEGLTPIRRSMERFFAVTTDLAFHFSQPLVHVIAPDCAAITAGYTFMVTPIGSIPHQSHGAWSAVVAVRGGRVVILQEHQSEAPAAESGT